MTDSPVSLAAHVRRDLSVDQKHALKTAATRLHTEFGEHFGIETIERFLHSSNDQFAGRATIPNFVPLRRRASTCSARMTDGPRRGPPRFA